MTAFKGQTNEVTQVKLPSSIEQVAWTRGVAAPGATVGLEIFTHFVGNGAALQIELVDGQGKKHGVFKEQIAGNRFWTPVRVPAKAEQALVATVKLPKHGLEMTSLALLLTPPVELKNAKWSAEEARRGDVLTLSADAKGAPDGTEAVITVWEHDADGAHDLVTRMWAIVEGERVEAEWKFEYAGDTDDIATEEEAEKGYQPPEYFFRVNVGGLTAESQTLRFKDWVEFVFLHADGEPNAGVDVTIVGPDGHEIEKTTDADGVVRIDDASPGRYRLKQRVRR